MSGANEMIDGRIATVIFLMPDLSLKGKLDIEQLYIHNNVVVLFRNCCRFKNYTCVS
jgi:hypothetical protein